MRERGAYAAQTARCIGRVNLFVEYYRSSRELIVSVARNRAILAALAKRDVSDEYVEHGFARLWPIVHPLVLMGIYLFVFTYVFPARTGLSGVFRTDSVVYLMSGIIPWIALSQIMGKATTSILNNTVLVKQMAFPLEFLPIKTLTGPLYFGLVSLFFLVVYAGYKTDGDCLPIYAIGIPILCIITLVFAVGIALLFASIQVFVRDFREFVNIFVAIGLFIHPILYFPDAVPEAVRTAILVSPFTYLLYCWQDVLFYGEITHEIAWVVSPILAIFMFATGARIFMFSKSHFGDFL